LLYKGPAYLSSADYTLVLVVSKAALVADAHQGRRSDIGIAHGAFAVALIAQAADCNAGLLAAHNEIAGKLLAY
jgi:hypothetical protein